MSDMIDDNFLRKKLFEGKRMQEDRGYITGDSSI